MPRTIRDRPSGIITEYSDQNGIIHRYYDDGEAEEIHINPINPYQDRILDAGATQYGNTHIVAFVHGMLINETAEPSFFGQHFKLFERWNGAYHLRHPVFILRDIVGGFVLSNYAGEDFRKTWDSMIEGLMQFSDTVAGDDTVPWISQEREVFRECLMEIFTICEQFRVSGRFNSWGDFYGAMWNLYDQVIVCVPGGILAQKHLLLIHRRPQEEEHLAPPSIPPDLI